MAVAQNKLHGAAMQRFDHAVLEGFPRVQLALLPTPIQELKRFSEALGGPRIFVKRDDQTGLAGGGNKTRKLEFLMGDALSKGADCVITAGAVQSNHCRQTAAAAAKLGLTCHLVFGGNPPSTASGNFLFDQLLGADCHFTEKHLRNQKMESLAEVLRTEGKSPYIIPVGGSNHIGALGYVSAMVETSDQLEALNLTMDHLIFATSSGGTQAGLVLGAKLCGFNGDVTGISIDQVPDKGSEFKFKAFVHDIVKDLERAMKIPNAVNRSDLKIDYGYLGKGYGVVGELECGAIRLLAGKEGLLVGPVYTGRALGALIDYIKTNKIGPKETVLFIHTGDDVALHAYAEEITRT
jgi:D-cysteine desulfhydrase